MAIIKLNAEYKKLETAQEKIEAKIAEIEAKIESIYDRTWDNDGDGERELTKREQNQIERYEEDISDLRCEFDEIQNALDYLEDYCEW